MNWKDHQKDVESVIYALASSLPRINEANRGLGQKKSELLAAAIKKIEISSFDSEKDARNVIWHFWKMLSKAGIVCLNERLWYLSIYGSAVCNRHHESLLSAIVDEKEATIHNNLMERLGVSAIENFFCRMGWIFRERTHTDYGIDADVEMPEKGHLSSRHIALQIKSGVSFFSSPGNATYNMDWSHLQYWLLSDRPVVFMIHDPRDNSVYWEQVLPGVDLYKSSTFSLRMSHKLTEDSSIDFERIAVSYLPIIQTVGRSVYSDKFALFAYESYLDSCKSLINQYSSFIDSLMDKSPSENSLYFDLLRIELSVRFRVNAVYLSTFFFHVHDSNNDWSNKVEAFVTYQKKWIEFLDGLKRQITEYQGSKYASQSSILSFTLSMCVGVLTEYIEMGNRFLSTGEQYLQDLKSLT